MTPYIGQAVQEDDPDAGCCLEKQSESNLSYSEQAEPPGG